jgi:OmpA-OmpF porin, OOP family
MIAARPILLLASAAALVCGCGPKQIRPAPPRGTATIVLLPDPDTGTVGRAAVSNPAGNADLAAARAATTVVVSQAPSPVTTLSESDVQNLFGAALAALPPPPQHFTLYFKFDSDELTDESRALVQQIVQVVKERPVPEVLVIGHTDTTGTSASNFSLGLKRATTVRGFLVDAGLDASFVEVTSHGEADLLVPTADEVPEPRNRRVEITIR